MGQRDQQVIGHRSKLHLRVRRLGGQELRLLTPRPGTDLVLSNNRYHDTWHLLSDVRGARQLGHLLWFLAYQRQPGTALLLDAPFVVSTPFDGDRARPVLIVPWELTGIGRPALDALERSLGALGPPDTSVRVDTHGLLSAGADAYPPRHVVRRARETMRLRGGFIEYRADRTQLMCLARYAMRVHPCSAWSSYAMFADDDGELQLFTDFRARVGEAARTRAELGLQPGFATSADQERLWDETSRRVWRQQRARRR